MYPNSTETEAPALGTLPDLALGTSSSICHLCPLLCNSHTGMHLSEFCELLEHVIETGEGLWGPQLVAKSNRSMGISPLTSEVGAILYIELLTSGVSDTCRKLVSEMHCRIPTWCPVIVQALSHVQLFVTSWTQHTRPPCPSLSPRVFSNSYPLSR